METPLVPGDLVEEFTGRTSTGLRFVKAVEDGTAALHRSGRYKGQTYDAATGLSGSPLAPVVRRVVRPARPLSVEEAMTALRPVKAVVVPNRPGDPFRWTFSAAVAASSSSKEKALTLVGEWDGRVFLSRAPVPAACPTHADAIRMAYAEAARIAKDRADRKRAKSSEASRKRNAAMKSLGKPHRSQPKPTRGPAGGASAGGGRRVIRDYRPFR